MLERVEDLDLTATEQVADPERLITLAQELGRLTTAAAEIMREYIAAKDEADGILVRFYASAADVSNLPEPVVLLETADQKGIEFEVDLRLQLEDRHK